MTVWEVLEHVWRVVGAGRGVCLHRGVKRLGHKGPIGECPLRAPGRQRSGGHQPLNESWCFQICCNEDRNQSWTLGYNWPDSKSGERRALRFEYAFTKNVLEFTKLIPSKNRSLIIITNRGMYSRNWTDLPAVMSYEGVSLALLHPHMCGLCVSQKKADLACEKVTGFSKQSLRLHCWKEKFVKRNGWSRSSLDWSRTFPPQSASLHPVLWAEPKVKAMLSVSVALTAPWLQWTEKRLVFLPQNTIHVYKYPILEGMWLIQFQELIF